LAGPVVAAAVIFPVDFQLAEVDDSKKLSAPKRSKLDIIIRDKALSYGIGLAKVEEIDRLNILQATFLAMRRAVEALRIKPDYLLVDGRDFPSFVFKDQSLQGEAIIKGDAKSAVIAAASILAKVYRDRLMEKYADEFPDYGFEKHKGYGTRFHRDKILEFGPCPIHRKKFLRKIMFNAMINKFII